MNVGANRDSPDRVADYVRLIEAFAPVADYITVNVSSPNTPGLRDLQAPAALDELLSRLMEARAALVAKGKRGPPIVVKISPDIAEDDLGAIVERLVAHAVDGIAVSNTTLARTGLTEPAARESGGLSGRPLFHRSRQLRHRDDRVARLRGDRDHANLSTGKKTAPSGGRPTTVPVTRLGWIHCPAARPVSVFRGHPRDQIGA